MKEKESDQNEAAAGDRAPSTARRKREHKQSIRRRLKRN